MGASFENFPARHNCEDEALRILPDPAAAKGSGRFAARGGEATPNPRIGLENKSLLGLKAPIPGRILCLLREGLWAPNPYMVFKGEMIRLAGRLGFFSGREAGRHIF